MNWMRPKLVIDQPCQRLGNERLGHARHALQQHVAAAEKATSTWVKASSWPTMTLAASARIFSFRAKQIHGSSTSLAILLPGGL